jgi:SHS2 domain-containing protein
MAKKFEFLPHPADEYIVGYGTDLREAYENLALGLNEFRVPLKEVKSEVTRSIEVESEDLQALAFDFLTQFLILHDSENLVFGEVKVTSFEKTDKGYKIKATTKGEEFNPDKHHQGTAIKAITYHNLEIKEQPDNVSIKILVDI